MGWRHRTSYFYSSPWSWKFFCSCWTILNLHDNIKHSVLKYGNWPGLLLVSHSSSSWFWPAPEIFLLPSHWQLHMWSLGGLTGKAWTFTEGKSEGQGLQEKIQCWSPTYIMTNTASINLPYSRSLMLSKLHPLKIASLDLCGGSESHDWSNRHNLDTHSRNRNLGTNSPSQVVLLYPELQDQSPPCVYSTCHTLKVK